MSSALRGLGLRPPVVDRTLRSQLDSLATFADLFGLEGERGARTVGDSLFAAERRWPVVVDLGNRVYFPGKQNAVWWRDDLLKGKGVESETDKDGRAYFLGLQHLLATGQSGR